MIVLLSPAKSLNFYTKVDCDMTNPVFEKQSKYLASVLKKKKPKDLMNLMSISENLASLNYDRFAQMQFPQKAENLKPAVFAFTGDVYQGLEIDRFTKEHLNGAQKNLRILSGLYGLLRPLDGIQPYRLEMGTQITTKKGKNLYEFWEDGITKELNKHLKENNTNVLVNLASNEYFKSIQTKKLKAEIITPNFKEFKNNKYQFISFNAKKARGLMAAYIIKNKLENPEDIKSFMEEDYAFNPNLSKGNNWIFTRINKTN